MKYIFPIIALVLFFACDTDTPITVDQQDTEVQEQGIIPAKTVQEGPHTYNARKLDSLSTTYKSNAANLEDGIYYITESSTATINLLPMELWEIVLPRNAAFFHRAKPKDTWCLVHRLDKVLFSTAARPLTVNKDASPYEVLIPFDGTSSSKMSNLLSLRAGGNFALVLDKHITSIFYGGEGIASDGLHISTEFIESVEFLEEYYAQNPE